MTDQLRPWTVVTGAAGGLGREVAARLSARGERVLWLMHPSESDAPLPLGPHDAREVLDFAAEDAGDRIAELCGRYSDVASLVHCAGRGCYSRLAALTDDDALAVLRVNFTAPVLLTHAWWRTVVAHRGAVTLVSSVVAASRNPQYSLYCAAKAALEHFGRSLQAEEPRVAVLIARPGALRTTFHARSGVPFPIRHALPPEVAAEVLVPLIGRRGVRYFRAWERLIPAVHRIRDVAELLLPARRRWPVGAPTAISGASAGIGAALRAAMTRDGMASIGWARRGGTDVAPMDVRAWRTVLLLDVRGLVLNAGVNHAGRLADVPREAVAEMLQTNAEATVMLALRHLRASALEPERWLLIVSSLATQLGYPGSAVYGATKELVSRVGLALGSTESLWTGVVWPGPVDTMQARRASPRGDAGDGRMDADLFAATVWAAVKRGERRIFGRPGWRVAAVVGLLLPGVVLRIMRRMMLPADRPRRSGI